MQDFKFDFSGLNFGGAAQQGKRDAEKEYIHAAKIPHKPVCYENALALAGALNPAEDYFCLVSGAFIYGDFLEALAAEHKLKIRHMYVSTLGMSENNVDSLVNLVDYLGVKRLDLIVSSYFVGTERHGLVPYMVREFSGRPVRVAVCASHTKTALLELEDGGNIVIYGSANLSSSNNLEEFTISHDPEIFGFCKRMMSGIIRDFTIIDGAEKRTIFSNNKGNRRNQIYRKVVWYTTEGEDSNG